MILHLSWLDNFHNRSFLLIRSLIYYAYVTNVSKHSKNLCCVWNSYRSVSYTTDCKGRGLKVWDVILGVAWRNATKREGDNFFHKIAWRHLWMTPYTTCCTTKPTTENKSKRVELEFWSTTDSLIYRLLEPGGRQIITTRRPITASEPWIQCRVNQWQRVVKWKARVRLHHRLIDEIDLQVVNHFRSFDYHVVFYSLSPKNIIYDFEMARSNGYLVVTDESKPL